MRERPRGEHFGRSRPGRGRVGYSKLENPSWGFGPADIIETLARSPESLEPAKRLRVQCLVLDQRFHSGVAQKYY